jgi:hypothetical protein
MHERTDRADAPDDMGTERTAGAIEGGAEASRKTIHIEELLEKNHRQSQASDHQHTFGCTALRAEGIAQPPCQRRHDADVTMRLALLTRRFMVSFFCGWR